MATFRKQGYHPAPLPKYVHYADLGVMRKSAY